MRRAFLAITIALLLSGCGTFTRPVDVLDVKRDSTHRASFAGLPIRSGQIILTESPEATSFAFALIPDKFYNFTHAGIVALEDNEAWVYEASGELATIPTHARLLDNVSGGVHRRPLFEYIAPNLYAEIFDPPPNVDGEKVAAFARARYADKTKFDAYFRWEEHETLFCTELVELSLRAGGSSPIEPGGVRFQPSLDLALGWLGVRRDQAFPAGIYEDESRFVAALGQFPSRVNAHAYFAAKRELYRRFHHPDQRLGFIFTMKGSGEVHLREEIADFVVNASHLFDAWSPPPDPRGPEIIAGVRAFADRTFGPSPD